MKFFFNIICILIIFFKTGNVLSDTAIFNVNNIKIDKEYSKNKEKLANEAFQKGFDSLINRLLLKKDYDKLQDTKLSEIKKLISYYQITESPENNDKYINVNIFFNKNNIHNFFYDQNILYSDIINTEAIFFPLLIRDKNQFIYSKNYFLENWKKNEDDEKIIQYTLPLESIESIQIIKKYEDDIFKLSTSEFFKEYDIENKIFAIIEKDDNKSKIFLKTQISDKKINKTLIINNSSANPKEFNDLIIFEIKKTITEAIKSQNLIDVRTPSFINFKINLKNEGNLETLNTRLDDIDLISNFYVQELNKDYAVIKIRYFGRITKIIKKLKDKKMNLRQEADGWVLNII